MAVLSKHVHQVNSLAFSSDGTSLVSGSNDKDIKLWDVQTGGVIKTFSGHSSEVTSVSISSDCTMITSGSVDGTVYLWVIQTGEHHCIVLPQKKVTDVNLFPSSPQHLISISQDGIIREWDIDKNKIHDQYEGSHIAFSPDGTHFVLCKGEVATVQSSDPGVAVAMFHLANSGTHKPCFSPNGRLIAVATGDTVDVWSTTNSDPCLIGTFIGHTKPITSIAFSSSLISASDDKSVKFWHIGTLLNDPAITGSKSTPPISAPIKYIVLRARDGLAISCDLYGMVKTWDISTGHCIASFKTPAEGSSQGDTQLMDSSGLVFVWWTNQKIHIWDNGKGELQMVDVPGYSVMDIRISGDRSKVFCLDKTSIQVWSILTGEVGSKVVLGGKPLLNSLIMDGSRVWVHFEGLQIQGWDFGFMGTSPIPLSCMAILSLPTYHLDSVSHTCVWNTSSSGIEDTDTGGEVFKLSGRYSNPTVAQWDGQYLVAGYNSGEVLILDFNHMIPH